VIWTAVLVASAGCFALKLAGWSLPARWLEHERLQRAAVLLPVALLAALVVVQAFAATGSGDGSGLVLDARAAGLVVARCCSPCARRSCWWSWRPRRRPRCCERVS
jgi:hypothetical protein